MIITGAIVERIATRKDKTAAVTIGTQELNPKLASDIFGLNQSFCYVAFKSEQFTKADIDDIEIDCSVRVVSDIDVTITGGTGPFTVNIEKPLGTNLGTVLGAGPTINVLTADVTGGFVPGTY